MKRLSKGIISRTCILFGVILLVVAIAVLVYWQCSIDNSKKQNQIYVNTLRSLVPEPQNAIPEERRDNTMSVFSVDGVDFVGIIEIPGYGSALPVCANWGQITKYPCRFSGSIYNSTLMIGATTQKGQYDFYREISVGDTVVFTDMEGNRFTLTVTDLRYEKHADQSTLTEADAALTLFIKNIFAFEYLIVSCNVG